MSRDKIPEKMSCTSKIHISDLGVLKKFLNDAAL